LLLMKYLVSVVVLFLMVRLLTMRTMQYNAAQLID